MNTNNPELDAVWAAEPILKAVQDAKASIALFRAGLGDAAGIGGLNAEVEGLLMAGQPVPEDLVSRVSAAAAAAEAHNRTNLLLTALLQSLQEKDRQARSAAAHAGLTRLDGRVVEIVEEAQKASEVLSGAVSADAALMAGDREAAAWRELVRLSNQYQDVRGAQRVLLTAARAVGEELLPGSALEILAVAGEIRSYTELWPQWRSAGAGAVRGVVASATPPWPHHPDGTVSRGPEFLLWAAGEGPHTLWVPSVAEMVDVWRAAVAAAERMSTPKSSPGSKSM